MKPKPPRWVSSEIEGAVANHFGWRQNVIVPNVSYGLMGHEADVVVMKQSGWAEEVEIKISAADIKRDLGKNNGKGHRRDCRMRKLWFAVPEHLAGDPNIPAFAGILSLSRNGYGSIRVTTARAPELNKNARKLTDAEQLTLARLGCMRIWSLKTALLRPLMDARHRDVNVDKVLAYDKAERDARWRWEAPTRQWCEPPQWPS